MNLQKLVIGMLAISSALVVSGAQAATAVTADVGTTGLGLHLTVPVKDNLNARFGVNGLNYSYTGSTSNVDYDFKLKERTFDALLDFYPAANDFRISGGLVYNGNKVDATGKPNGAGNYTINGNTYTASSAGTLNGHADFRSLAPYLGIGYGNPVKKAGWNLSADLGVLFQGSPSTSLTNSGCTADAATCGALATDVAAENARLADKASNLRYFPVVRVGISRSF
jgi:hypothetical protein